MELHHQRAKLYRWRDREWDNRWKGDAKLLLQTSHRMVRFRLGQEETMANDGDFMIGGDWQCSDWVVGLRLDCRSVGV